MKAGAKTALRTAAWSTSALLVVGVAAGTASAAAHKQHVKKHKASSDADNGSGDATTRPTPPKVLHDVATVETGDGSFEEYATQHGTVAAVSDTSLTVVSDDEYSATYVIEDDTVVLKDGAKSDIGDVATGDTVLVRAEDEDGTLTAEVIGDGKPPAAGNGGQPGAGGPGAGGPGAGGPGAGGPGGPMGHRPPPGTSGTAPTDGADGGSDDAS